jgi:hypothetical protein
MHGKERGLKIVSCSCFLLLVVALLLIDRHSPATAYELSIYDSLPALMWICLIAVLAGAIGIIVHQAFAERKSKYWLLGFFIIIFGVSIILLLPAFRGYFLYGSNDTMGHLEFSEIVLSTGHFHEGNRYPITHILMAQLSQICAMSPELVIKYIPMFFTILSMLFSYLLASSVMPRKGQALLAAVTTALFFNYYHVSVYPQVLSIMILPLVFYLYFKGFGGLSLPFRVGFVIVLLALVFFHPATTVVLIGCFLAAEAAKVVWRAIGRPSPSDAIRLVERITLEPTLICTVAFLTWVSSWVVFHRTIQKMWGWLAGEIQSIPRVEEVEQILESQGLTLRQQIELSLKMYGDNLILLLLCAIALLIIARRILHREDEVRELSMLSMPFLVSGPIWVLIFGGTLHVTMGRLLGANVMMWATPVLAAFALYDMLGRWKRVGAIVITSVLLCTWLVSIFGVYHSPYIRGPSWHLTHQDVQGTGWFGTHATIDVHRSIAGLGVPAALVSGRVPVPAHFGYHRLDRLGEAWQRDWYLILAQPFRVAAMHPILSKTMISDPAVARQGFDEADFERLEWDSSVQRVYSNGGLNIYCVRSET